MNTICGFVGDDDKNLLKKMDTNTGNQKYSEKNFSVSAPAIAVNEQGIVIAFNGVIYNNEELIRQTGSSPGNGDADILLILYTAEGEKFIPKINGSFSSPSGIRIMGFFSEETETVRETCARILVLWFPNP